MSYQEGFGKCDQCGESDCDCEDEMVDQDYPY